ncbi:MAG: adenylate/guanylate cyclase domain-containing protein [Candidatus Latescibacteria bacterium]|nr:adenylate/guanylate cyclase domain-containing protein [Candidatus Latescibacterota bacterium]
MATSRASLGRLAAFLVAALLVALGVWRFCQIGLMRSLEDQTLDWRFLFRGPRGTPPEDIVLVLVEEEAELDYRSPIPREHLAQVVEHLGGARLVGLDILFDKPSFDHQGDLRLRTALAKQGHAIAVSYLADGEEHFPHPYFRDVLLDVGYSTFPAAGGGEAVRRGTVLTQVPGGFAVSFAGALVGHARGIEVGHQRSATSPSLVGVGPGQMVLIDFSGPPNAAYRRAGEAMPGGFTVCPSHLVAAGVYPADFFNNKIVLIGTGLADAPDLFRTPFFSAAYGYQKMLGVEIHAQFLHTLLRGAPLGTWGQGKTFGVLLLLVLAIGVGVLRAGVGRGAIGSGCLILGLWGLGFALFSRLDRAIPLVTLTTGMVAAFGASTAFYARTEGREKKQMRQMFAKYLSPQVVDELVADPSHWALGGKSMEITVMFADLEGFTPLCERLEPQEVVKLMNHHLTELSRFIWMEGGTIDKYEGDLIMAFFGAPLPQADHAARACRAALQMQTCLAELRSGPNSQGLRMRIGLHSGTAVVGNMGSDFHFNYTAMGDTVNLAARLEPANKQFGTYILVSEVTQHLAGAGEFHYRALGAIQVKGKTEPVRVAELLPRPADPV